MFSGSISSSAWEFTCLAVKKILCQEKSEHLSGEMGNRRRCGRLGIEKAASGGWCLHLLHSVIMEWVQSKQIRAKFEARTLLSCKIFYVSPQREQLKSVIPPTKEALGKEMKPKGQTSARQEGTVESFMKHQHGVLSWDQTDVVCALALEFHTLLSTRLHQTSGWCLAFCTCRKIHITGNLWG